LEDEIARLGGVLPVFIVITITIIRTLCHAVVGVIFWSAGRRRDVDDGDPSS
jgi:thiamine transporter ThiT